jgi:hypothetical protein
VDRRLGGPQSRSGRSGEEKNPRHLPVFEPPIIHPVSPVLYHDILPIGVEGNNKAHKNKIIVLSFMQHVKDSETAVNTQ